MCTATAPRRENRTRSRRGVLRTRDAPSEARDVKTSSRRSALALCALLALSLGACASTGAPTDRETRAMEAALEAPAEAGLHVRLGFAADVDLDLYVSDPSLETVYYANTPSRSGGVLIGDQRCENAEASPRIEGVHFDAPQPGRYRVGVDFPEACDGAVAAPFVVRIDVGGAVHRVRGRARRLHFDSRVLEFELDADGRLVP